MLGVMQSKEGSTKFMRKIKVNHEKMIETQ